MGLLVFLLMIAGGIVLIVGNFFTGAVLVGVALLVVAAALLVIQLLVFVFATRQLNRMRANHKRMRRTFDNGFFK